MKIQINQTLYQFYIIPCFKITYSRLLNGDYEIIFGWLNRELCICF
jgi:hypothetical protein